MFKGCTNLLIFSQKYGVQQQHKHSQNWVEREETAFRE
jgi:hypothetical protein